MKDFDKKEDYFMSVYNLADLVEQTTYFTAGEIYKSNVPVMAIQVTTYPSFYVGTIERAMTLYKKLEFNSFYE